MSEQENETVGEQEWPEAPRSEKRSRLRQAGRGVWNVLAIFGIAGILATSFGLVQGYRQYSPLPGVQSEPPTSESGPLGGPSAISLPDSYVGADIQAIPPLAGYPLAGAAVNLQDTFERVLVFPALYLPAAKRALTEAERWIVDEAGLSYECGKSTSKLLPPNLSDEAIEIVRCERPLRPYEARAAQAEKGSTLFILVPQGERSFIMQWSFSGDEEQVQAKARKLLADVKYAEVEE